jgi:hypothetical protein
VNGCQLQDGECRGRLEWHHAIKQQRLKRAFPHGHAGPRKRMLSIPEVLR